VVQGLGTQGKEGWRIRGDGVNLDGGNTWLTGVKGKPRETDPHTLKKPVIDGRGRESGDRYEGGKSIYVL